MRVLVADDEATGRMLLATAVQRLGHDVVTADDGDEAWALYEEHHPDVLLTDRRMPGTDGLELVRRIRGDGSGTYTFVILATAMGEREDVLEGMHAGADDYLVKPVDRFELQVRLIAAERTLKVHRRLADTASELRFANADLGRLARTDRLTDVGNRLRLEEDLRAVHARACRDDNPYALVLADIDHFKAYNDLLGHVAGDEALRQVAECLRRACRTSDRIYRYGGEELVALLPATSAAEAEIVAERLRAAVEDLGIAHPAEPGGVLTMSLGVAGYVSGDADDADVVGLADEALYRAKDAGRNRVEVSRRATAGT